MIKSIAIVYLYLFLQMTIVWVIYRVLKNPSVVDVSWSLGLMMAGLIYLGEHTLNLRTTMIAALLIIWALRLAGYLWYTRIRLGHVDKRYLELSHSWKIAKSLGFFLNFQLQALFILILSIVFLFAATDSPTSISLVDGIAAFIVALGIGGESIADLQLNQFKSKHKGKTCDVGLWQYSRHPNYFFELLVWCGFFLFGLQHNFGWVGIVSPIWLYIIFTKMTIPITERSSIHSRGQAYLDYQQKTSMLFPWPPKRANS